MSETNSQSAPRSLEGLLDHFVDVTEGDDDVSIGQLLDSLKSRSHGPMLLFPAIIAVSPIGMIPGMSIVTGTLVILIATQMMFFSDRPWIPKRLANFKFSRKRLTSGVERIQPWVKWFETIITNRLEFLTKGLAIYPIALISILLAISFYPLALVPFGVLVPGLGVTLLALGLTARDGLLVLIGIGTAVGTSVLLWYFWPF